MAGTIINDGTFKLASTNSLTRLMLAGDTTLDGTGETVLGGIYNYIGSSATNKTLTIGADQTLRGGGLIGSSSYGEVDVVNKGTVVADNGTLYTYGSTFNNAAGEIQVSSGAALYVQKGMLNGGSISGAGTLTGSGTFQDVHYSGGLNVSGGTIQGGHIDDTLTVTNGGYVSMAGTITNDGTFKLASTNSLTRLMLAGDTTLDGTGETVLGGIYNYIGSSTTNKTLTIGADQTLRGGGLIGSSSYGEVDVVNKGTVVADNGTLYTYGSTFNNAAGEIQVSSGAALYVQKGMLNGGSISGAGTLTGSGTFQDVHYSGGLNVSGGTIQGGHIDDTLTVTNGGYVSMAGTITNDGTFKMAGANSTTLLMLAGDTTLDGTGETVLAESTTTSAAVLQVTL
ncbi:hypothetical protein [Plasticicumulans sp.]|uniref:hypothetical protein n=1 Tax=Plasticicumulans sp. TaxID=2307179 RepID=UPI003960BA80